MRVIISKQTAAVLPPAGLALLFPLAYHHREQYPGMRQIVLIGSARDWKSALHQMQIEQRPMLPGFERIYFSDSHPCAFGPDRKYGSSC
jgi:hypothetical protein